MRIHLVLLAASLLAVGCSTVEKSAFVPILGSSHGWADANRTKIIDDVKVSGLRIRVTQDLNSDTCSSGVHHSIEIDGPINKDTSYVLSKVLENLPKCKAPNGNIIVTAVYLNSAGGTLEDGYAIGKVFRTVGVSARVIKGQVCASACAVAFIGGSFRSIQQDGTLIFHAPYRRGTFGEVECPERSSVAAERLKSYYTNMIGDAGNRLFERTMDYCSTNSGWTVDAGAAKFFGLLR
jgi:ATP-dependent protease ClpP protease subunit